VTYRLNLIALACASLALPALADTPAADEPKPQRVEITGTMIKRIDSETPAPVKVLKRDDILRSGATTVDELLRMDPSTGAGGLDDMGTGSGFSAGTASISMRGMGSAATLVLVNGRRISPAAVVDVNSGQSTIFNVNSIPMSAIERIEILKSGASSLYGSDALAGVVNVILRNNYTGKLIELNAKQRFDGLFKSHTANGVWGVGDFGEDGYNVFVGVELFKRDGVGITEAPDLVQSGLLSSLYSRLTPSSSSSYPGNLYTYNNGSSGSFRGMLSPNCATPGPYSATVSTPTCLWDSTRFAQYTGAQERGSVFVRGSYALSGDTTLNAELMASTTTNDYDGAPSSRTEMVTAWGDAEGNTIRFNGLALPATHPDNPTRLASVSNPVQLPNSSGGMVTYTQPTVLGLRYRFADIPYSYHTKAENLRAVLSGTTTLGEWDIDAGLLHHYQRNSKRLGGRLSLSGLNQALADGSYRFGGNNSPEVLAQISPMVSDSGVSTTSSADLRGSRQIGQLAGGAAMLGLGAELRHEGFEVDADSRTAAGDIIGRGIAEANGSRNIAAAYAELQLPLIQGLETQSALRVERYTDFGSAITAKLGAKYNLSSVVALRGSWANGFRAPSLSQSTDSTVFAFSSGLRDPKLCPVYDRTNVNCALSISTVSLSNPNLKPEKSDAYTLGMLIQPTPESEIVLDAWYIERRGEIDRLSSQEVLNRQDEFPGAVLRLDSGQVYQVRRSYLNLAKSATTGVDYELSQRFKLDDELGRLRLSVSGTYMFSRKRQTEAGQPTRQTVGYYLVPRNKFRAGANWTVGDWSNSLALNYQSGFQSFDAGNTCDATLVKAGYENLCRISAWKTVDLSVSYTGFAGVKLSATVRNLTGAKPPLDPNETEIGVNSAVANALGRYLSLTASYEF